MKIDRRKVQTVIISAAAIVAVTAIVVSYRSGNVFEPSGESRKMQANQVAFPDDGEVTGQETQKDSDESSLWENNRDEKEYKGPKENNQANYLFMTETIHQPAQAQMGSVMENQTGQEPVQGEDLAAGENESSQTVYDVTQNVDNADMILGGGVSSVPGNSSVPGENGNAGSGDGTIRPGLPTSTPTDSSEEEEPDMPQEPGNVEKPDIPAPRPSYSDTAKDPEGEKSNPTVGVGTGNITSKPYDEDSFPGTITGNADNSVMIQKPMGQSDNALYIGQTIDKKTIYYSLNTYVVGKGGVQYLWGADALDTYVRIDGVSFDGGQTWITDFPVVIPDNVEDGIMLIQASYRFSTKGNWIPKQVSYEVEVNRIFVLSKRLEEENATIDKSTILNWDQYPDVGEKINLFGIQYYYLKEQQPQTSLSPGWIENGKLVPWFYPVTAGRHILEPAESVPLEDGYCVELQYKWMSDDYEVGWQYDNLCYLQTLTDFDPDRVWNAEERDADVDRLTVPRYVQSVDIAYDKKLSVDYLEIPDTVIYYAYESSGLKVQKGYLVDENNSHYASTEDGMLLNKARTEILNVPYQARTIMVPASVKQVSLSYDNQISSMTLEAETTDTMPLIAWDRLSHCKIYLAGALVRDFFSQNSAALGKSEGNVVVVKENPKTEYRLVNGGVITNQGELYFAVSDNADSMQLPYSVSVICPDAFSEASGIDSLLLARERDNLTLSENCFRGSNIAYIYCYTQKQYNNIVAQLAKSGASQNIKVEILSQSREGFLYTQKQMEDGGLEYAIMSAPAEITSFDGILTDGEGNELNVTSIATDAFADCTNLQWVDLPENIVSIGSGAFRNCTSLEGFLIETKDHIFIGNEAWDGCSSLRFVASNAQKATMQDDYSPLITDRNNGDVDYNYFFFVPTNAEGYGWYYVSFTENSGVDGYTMCRIEDADEREDCRVLYGVDEEQSPWLALRSGIYMPRQASLPDTTVEIYEFALADTRSFSGPYELNWDNLCYTLGYVDRGAFYHSQIQGDIVLPAFCRIIGNMAFKGCNQITSFTVPGFSYFTDLILSGEILQDCGSLQSITFGEFDRISGLDSGIFTGCDALTDLYIESSTPPSLTMYLEKPFQFNTEWNIAEEGQRMRIHVPSWLEEEYIMEWRYSFAGIYVQDSDSSYVRLWNQKWMELYNELLEIPQDEAVDVRTEASLLTAENRLRTMLGWNTVDMPTNLYKIHESQDGMLTLVGAPIEALVVNLGDIMSMELPFGWYLDYVGTGAFAGCSQLEKVIVPDTLAAFYTDAFAGNTSQDITLELQSTEPVELLGGTLDHPFSFGMDESKLHIKVPEGSEMDYINSWMYPLIGYRNERQYRTAVIAELTVDGETPSEELVNHEIARRLLPVENRLRSMMGMEQKELEADDRSVSGSNTGSVSGGNTGSISGDDIENHSIYNEEKFQKTVSGGNN